MIIFILILSFIKTTMADPGWRWSTAVDIVEKHEFYGRNEMITKPAGGWQILFGVAYHNPELKLIKDCVFYRVPGEKPGELKIKTIPESEPCEKFLFKAGDESWEKLKALQYSIEPLKLTMYLTHGNFDIERWIVPLFNVHEKPELKPLVSSAEYRSQNIIFLAPQKDGVTKSVQKPTALPDKTKCHVISDLCEETSASICSQCSNGWYEVPNGCAQGPKYCGVLECGGKNMPACRRGIKYQRMRKKFDCRTDSSFAYCSKGFSIQCEGSEAYCI